MPRAVAQKSFAEQFTHHCVTAPVDQVQSLIGLGNTILAARLTTVAEVSPAAPPAPRQTHAKPVNTATLLGTPAKRGPGRPPKTERPPVEALTALPDVSESEIAEG